MPPLWLGSLGGWFDAHAASPASMPAMHIMRVMAVHIINRPYSRSGDIFR
ncbi:hypothetical protein GXY_14787 [Novacetimonas hansenii ATCC 23769]|uniref:Uncharacterized protein n=1 Tax=Novacetimonas hansenii ATCC 23769 TaxID=714995 RepID=D5QIH6_NOVHA|nr:hypothetical protein GXY_14787 [Novacetimonas hansenii ATCC 23769]